MYIHICICTYCICTCAWVEKCQTICNDLWGTPEDKPTNFIDRGDGPPSCAFCVSGHCVLRTFSMLAASLDASIAGCIAETEGVIEAMLPMEIAVAISDFMRF